MSDYHILTDENGDLLFDASNDEVLNDIKPFTLEWTVSGDETARTITLPLTDVDSYNAVVDWGDGTPTSTILSYNSTDRIHTYGSNGTYRTRIIGNLPGLSFSGSADRFKLTDIIDWGVSETFNGFHQLLFNGCENLISTGRGSILYDSPTINNASMFNDCYSLVTVRDHLFDNFQNNVDSAFHSTFRECTSLVTVPHLLFSRCHFAGNSAFSQTFYQCTAMSNVPKFNFHGDSQFNFTHYQNLGMVNPFQSNCFESFTGTTSVAAFSGTWQGCSNIETMPDGLFRPVTGVTNWRNALNGLIKLQFNPNIFYYDGEQSTRFLNTSPDFLQMFARLSFTGTQGTAPDLWNCDFGTGTPITTSCYGYAGNNATSISNYNDIPTAWTS